MISIGYMAKRVAKKPDWLKTDQVVDIYSVSGCTSQNFGDFIQDWRYNGYWFFDSPQIIQELAQAHEIDLEDTKMFYYEVYEFQCYEDDPEWEEFGPENSLTTDVQLPPQKHFEGYDIVTFTNGNGPECSYLSCNRMAEEITVNQHCLLETFEEAKTLLERKTFKKCEPGPCRIIAVYTIPNF